MGGRALLQHGVETRRYMAEEYHQLVEEVERRLDWLVTKHSVIKSYANKESFGDMDVLVTSYNWGADYIENYIRQHFTIRTGDAPPVEPKAIVHNGDVWSFEFRDFQIDLILVKPEEYEFARMYFAYNDLGNLMGRVAHKMGFKFGHNGLWYCVREGTYMFRQILITRDVFGALEFLGFSSDRYQVGFKSLLEIFQYVQWSRYFNTDIFLLENRSYKSKVRDAKRKTYMEFLEHLRKAQEYRDTAHERCEFIDYYEYGFPRDKNVWLEPAFKAFPEFRDAYDTAICDRELARLVKHKFSGFEVGRVTSLQGKELGAFMAYLRAVREHRYITDEQLVSRTQTQVNDWVLAEFVEWNSLDTSPMQTYQPVVGDEQGVQLKINYDFLWAAKQKAKGIK